jgi:cell division protein FtsW (lipid II flippase)
LGVITACGIFIIFYYASLFSAPEVLRRQLQLVLAGIPLLCFFYFFDYTKLEKFTLPVFYLTCILLLMAIFFGGERNGRACLFIGNLAFTPSFSVLPLILICFAGLVKRWCDGDTLNLLKLIGSAGLPLLIILMEPSLAYFFIVGTGLLVMITYGICTNQIFKASRKKTLLVLYACLFGLGLLLFIHFFGFQPWRIERVTVFLNPEKDPQGGGWTYTIIDKIIASAKFIGNDGSFSIIGENNTSMLPEANSHFVLVFVIGSLGWSFGIVLIVLLSLIIFRLFLAAGKIRHSFGKYMCIGICCVFSLQVIANVLMSLRLFPAFSVPLPFISYGGDGFLLNTALIGLFLGVYRRKDIIVDVQD